MSTNFEFRLTEQPIVTHLLVDQVASESSGAIVTFEGRVRDHNLGREVVALEYEVYPELAEVEARRILAEATERFGLLAARTVHRFGRLELSDVAVSVVVAASHRDEAFAACRYVIDELKQRVPIWKKEHYAAGHAGWVGCPRCRHREAPGPHPAPHGLNSLVKDESHTQALTEAARFSRQMILRDWGPGRQARLAQAKVLIVGVGGLGCPAAQYLAAAGVGALVLVDHDHVELSNLNRQTLYGEADLGQPKAQRAAEHLRAFSSFTTFKALAQRVTPENVQDLVAAADVVLDCSDNLVTRYLVGDACAWLRKPLVSAAVTGCDGQLVVLNRSPGSPCYRCVFPVPPDPSNVGNCAADGVVGAFVGIMGSLQALEAIKVLTGWGVGAADPAGSDLHCIQGASVQSERFGFRRRLDCPACGEAALPPVIGEFSRFTAETWPLPLPRLSFSGTSDARDDLPGLTVLPDELHDLVETGAFTPEESPTGSVRRLLIDVRSPQEFRNLRLRHSTNVPLEQILMEEYRPPNSKIIEIIVYCASGDRSRAAVSALQRLTQAPIRHLSGGLKALPNTFRLLEAGDAPQNRSSASAPPVV